MQARVRIILTLIVILRYPDASNVPKWAENIFKISLDIRQRVCHTLDMIQYNPAIRETCICKAGIKTVLHIPKRYLTWTSGSGMIRESGDVPPSARGAFLPRRRCENG